MLKRHAPTPQVAMLPGRSQPELLQQSHTPPNTGSKQTDLQLLPARKLPPATGAVKFWNQILDDAKKKLKEEGPNEPKKLVERPESSI
jgi:hypothetical protein